MFNPFTFENFTTCYSQITPFYQTITDFYLQEPIAAQSPVMAESSLFFSHRSNFHNER